MGWLRSTAGKWGARIKGVFSGIGTKFKDWSMGNRGKRDKAETWSFNMHTDSVLKRVKAMAMKMAKQLYDVLNKSAELRGKNAINKRDKIADELRKDIKGGLKINNKKDLEKAVDDRMNGKNPLLEQKRKKAERRLNDPNKSRAFSGLNRDVRDYNKSFKKEQKNIAKGKDLDSMLNKAKAKTENKLKAVEDMGLGNKNNPVKDLTKAR